MTALIDMLPVTPQPQRLKPAKPEGEESRALQARERRSWPQDTTEPGNRVISPP